MTSWVDYAKKEKRKETSIKGQRTNKKNMVSPDFSKPLIAILLEQQLPWLQLCLGEKETVSGVMIPTLH